MLPENMVVELLDVFLYHHKKSFCKTKARPFSALSLRLSGESRFTSGAEEANGSAGTIAFVPQGVTYDRTILCDEEIVVFHFMLCNGAAGEVALFTPDNPAPYRELFLRALSIWEAKEKGYRYRATALFYEILALMQREGVAIADNTQRDMHEAAAYLQKHFTDPVLSISALAKRFSVSEAYFRRRFAAVHGVSPKQYIDALRIGLAVTLLGSGYYSQVEIAARCGYSDAKYFRTAFRRKTGVTPAQCAREPFSLDATVSPYKRERQK